MATSYAQDQVAAADSILSIIYMTTLATSAYIDITYILYIEIGTEYGLAKRVDIYYNQTTILDEVKDLPDLIC